jgi:hypothetical protein
MEGMNTKPGYKTTEFYLSLAPWVLALGVLVLIGMGSVDVQAGMLMFSALGLGGGISNYGYAKGRADIKS